MESTAPILAPIKGAEHREIGGVQLDVVRAGAAVCRTGRRYPKGATGSPPISIPKKGYSLKPRPLSVQPPVLTGGHTVLPSYSDCHAPPPGHWLS